MPDYNFSITVPADTSKDSPIETELQLTRGVVTGGQIYFPYGCNNMVHLIICDANGQLYPANKQDTFNGNGVAIPLIGRYVLDSEPYRLIAKAWSPGTFYNHTLTLTLNVLTEEEIYWYKTLRDFTETFKILIGVT